MSEALRSHIERVLALIYDETVVPPTSADEADLAMLSLLGRHHWTRFAVSPVGAPAEARAENLAKALRALGMCFLSAEDISELPLPALTMLVETVMPDPVGAVCEAEGVTELDPERELVLLQRLLFATPPNSPRFTSRAMRFLSALEDRFDVTGDPAFLDAVVDTLAEIRVFRPGDPGTLAMSGLALMRRYHEGERRLTDLDEAATLLREALPGIPESGPERGAVVCALADVLIEKPGGADPAESARLLSELRVLEADPEWAGETERLSRLIIGLLSRSPDTESSTSRDILTRVRSLAELDGDEETLAELDLLAEVQELFDIDLDAVPDGELASVIGRAADVMAAAGIPEAEDMRALNLSMCGWAAASIEDLDSAVLLLGEALRQAAAGSDRHDEAIAARLAMVLFQRYEIRGDPLDRERAIALGRDLRPGMIVEPRSSTSATPPKAFAADMEAAMGMFAALAAHIEHSGTTDRVQGLLLRFGDLIRAQIAGEGTPAERVAAIDRELAVVDGVLTAETDPVRRTAIELIRLILRTMSCTIGDRFEDLAAITAEARRHLDADGLSERVAKTLGLFAASQDQLRLLLHRDRRGPASARLPPERTDRALADAARVSADASFGPEQRIAAARLTAQLATYAERPRVAALALADAVRLLPYIASVHVRPDRRERHFAKFTGVTGDAVALTLSTGGEPVEALRLLETGRSVLQAQVLDVRAELTALQEAAPELAARYKDLAHRLASDDTADGETPDWRHAAAEDYKHVTTAIRALDGFADFAGPPPASSLLAAAAEGPIVVLNLSEFGCDALITRPDGVTRLPLDVRHRDALTQVGAFVDAIDGLYAEPGFAVARRLHGRGREVLTWAHEKITGPVLDHLGLDTAAPEDCPRIWWAPGGTLGLLPLHAAGDFRTAHPVITADRAVSSYTPTIRHLLHSRTRMRSTGPLRGFAVAVSDGDPPLPYARLEAESLPPYFAERLHNADAAREAVLDLLPTRELAHFSCHGLSVPADPSTGCVLLGRERLTVADVTGLNLSHARLAYLSACRTAQNTNAPLIDESLHLAAAFQVAGFPHVVGTMWPIGDAAALAYSRSFYRALGPEPDPSRSARAVHTTMHEAREGLATAPHLWGGLIHYGA